MWLKVEEWEICTKMDADILEVYTPFLVTICS